ncbi:YqaA family protein [Candidatus Endomicrobiellum pyrsonymphae]|uniref:YqaA family protein n=1 Tax=Candidatus Endomicrobiellum pyrsonymphae TaxID=1408203 RepID=UPI0035A90294
MIGFCIGQKQKNQTMRCFYSICEKFFFPVPSDVPLIPIVVAEPKNWWKKALICTSGSVFGAFLGYAIGKFLQFSQCCCSGW